MARHSNEDDVDVLEQQGQLRQSDDDRDRAERKLVRVAFDAQLQSRRYCWRSEVVELAELEERRGWFVDGEEGACQALGEAKESTLTLDHHSHPCRSRLQARTPFRRATLM